MGTWVMHVGSLSRNQCSECKGTGKIYSIARRIQLLQVGPRCSICSSCTKGIHITGEECKADEESDCKWVGGSGVHVFKKGDNVMTIPYDLPGVIQNWSETEKKTLLAQKHHTWKVQLKNGTVRRYDAEHLIRITVVPVEVTFPSR